MDNILKGSRAFIKILDGNVITSELYSTEILVQRLKKDTSSPIPDWENSPNKPIIYPRILSQNTGKRINISSFKWYYNGKEIDKNDNRFEQTIHKDGEIEIPALKIIRNLVSYTNLDTDTISFEGNTTVGELSYTVKCSIDIRIEEVMGDAFDSELILSDSGVIDDNSQIVYCTAKLYKGGQLVTRDVKYQWYLINDDGKVSITPEDSGFPETVSLTKDDVDLEVTVLVDILYKDKKVATISRVVIDESDNYYLYLAMTNGTTIKEGESSIIIPRVYNRILDKEDTGYNFEFNILDDEFKLVERVVGSQYEMTSDKLKQYNNSLNVIVNASK